MIKKFFLVTVLASFMISTNVAAETNNDVAEIKAVAKSFSAKWKEGFNDAKKRWGNKDYKQCRNFANKPALTTKHGEQLKKLIHGNADAARKYAEPLFEIYIMDYTPADFEDTMYFVFDEPSEIAELCKDDEFSSGILKAMHAVMGK